jgi:chaperone BCS1
MSVLDLVISSTIVATIVAAILAALKTFAWTLPRKFWDWLVQRLTLSITFASGESGYALLRDWLADHPYAKKARAVKMVYNPAANKFVLAPGHGSHLLWFDKSPLWIQYLKTKPPGDSIVSFAEESYTVKMLALHHTKMERFLAELERYQKKEVSSLVVYTWRGGYWNWFGAKRKRSLDTVYMQESLKNEIIVAITNFLASEEWYAARGIPWRLGIMLEGGPGTGKTTLATALAGYFDKPLYSMNLATIGNDEALLGAFGSTRNGMVLIEDVDGFAVARDRGNIETEASPSSAPTEEFSNAPATGSIAGTVSNGATKKEGLTISGLLNAIDGVAASEGRILIMTTNDVSKLDPALLRSGRIDHRFLIGHLTPDDVVAMFKCFYPNTCQYHERIHRYAMHHSTTAAAWQKLFIQYHDSVDRLFTEIEA